MANNRLYIGNKETLEWECISKAYDGDWNVLHSYRHLKLINNIIETDNAWNKKTELVFFNESDDEMYDLFVNKVK